MKKEFLEYLKNNEWKIILLLTIFVIIFGTFGFLTIDDAEYKSMRFLDALYLSLQLFVLQSGYIKPNINLLLEIARFLAPVIVAYATIKSILVLLSTNFGLFNLKNHIIICGLSDKSFTLVNDLSDKKFTIVIIDNFTENINDQYSLPNKVIKIKALPSDSNALTKVKVQNAKYIFIMNEGDEINIKIATNIYRILGSEKVHSQLEKIICFIHIYEPVYEEIFKSHPIFLEQNDRLDARLINIYRKGSEILTHTYPIEVERKQSTIPKEKTIIISGFGRAGKSILIQNALIYHYTNEKLLTAIIVDPKVFQELEFFRYDYPSIYELINFKPLETSLDKLYGNEILAQNGNLVDAVYLCGGDDKLKIALTKRLRNVFTFSKIFICFQRNSDLTKLIKEGDLPYKQENLVIFNLLEETCKFEHIVNPDLELLAEKIHEMYYNVQIKAGETPEKNSSLKPWHELPEDLKDSNRQQAYHIKFKLNAFGYDIIEKDSILNEIIFTKNPDLLEKMSKAEHIRWVDEKLLKGWSFAPGKKDPVKRTHPDLIPYEELDEPTKQKDRDTILNIPEILSLSGKKIVKIV